MPLPSVHSLLTGRIDGRERLARVCCARKWMANLNIGRGQHAKPRQTSSTVVGLGGSPVICVEHTRFVRNSPPEHVYDTHNHAQVRCRGHPCHRCTRAGESCTFSATLPEDRRGDTRKHTVRSEQKRRDNFIVVDPGLYLTSCDERGRAAAAPGGTSEAHAASASRGHSGGSGKVAERTRTTPGDGETEREDFRHVQSLTPDFDQEAGETASRSATATDATWDWDNLLISDDEYHEFTNLVSDQPLCSSDWLDAAAAAEHAFQAEAVTQYPGPTSSASAMVWSSPSIVAGCTCLPRLAFGVFEMDISLVGRLGVGALPSDDDRVVETLEQQMQSCGARCLTRQLGVAELLVIHLEQLAHQVVCVDGRENQAQLLAGKRARLVRLVVAVRERLSNAQGSCVARLDALMKLLDG